MTFQIRLPLSQRQGRVLLYIYDFIARNSYPPTVAEIQADLEIVNPGSVHKALSALERKEYLIRKKNEARGIRLTVLGEEFGARGRQLEFRF